ncbi:DUF881 domain-containing protein [Mangrovihabitans endophyticus]|uniref:DUF881 domain-containing protein n=1 Tax=Mangrovihabitans endophyticus TaxID=1751298 RepID=A0A8J3C693_9ACTN|nr:DUF881 domain-containing protein [Mangrovihabitans endophyticus]GGL12484.1 hypothetical protein GCM10012284_53910 [Mangrovihabitans endophyticus]
MSDQHEPGREASPSPEPVNPPSARDRAGDTERGSDPHGADPHGADPHGTGPQQTSAAGADAPAGPHEAGPETGAETGGPESASAGAPADGPADRAEAGPPRAGLAPWRRLSSAGALIWLLLALFGFTLVVQLRSNNTDDGLASARQEDLVRILSDLEARDTRLQAEINALETSQRQLTSGVAGRQAARAEAEKRGDELGLLAGTLPGRGPGLRIMLTGVKSSAVLNAVQELRGAGGEVMELAGADGTAVRIVASTYFVDADDGGIVADGTTVHGPYTLWVIGAPQTMQTALQIPGGVVASVKSSGGSVTVEQRTMVDVAAVRESTSLRYAHPVS